MRKVAKMMTALDVGRLPIGMHAAGGATGLYLSVNASGSRSWIFRYRIGKRRPEMGLGGWPDVSLNDARNRAREARRKLDDGIDPLEARRSTRAALHGTPTFAECAAFTIAAKRPEWKNGKHADQWVNTLETYAFPFVGKLPVNQVELRHIVKILTPIWNTKTETAKRLRTRIEAVLAWATVSGYRTGDNPARWTNNLDALLPSPNKVSPVKHHRALPFDELPQFVADLRKREGISMRAFEFLILTAARSGEVRGATWDEFDLEAATWTIPGERMKAGKQHRVPLSPRALEIIRNLPRIAGTDYVFPAPRGGMLSDMAFTTTMRRMEVDAVPHGFRSTFRDWAAERTSYPRDVAEMALAHTIGDKVEAAYRRGDLMAKRTKMMHDWERFIYAPPATGNVVDLRGATA